MPRPDPDDEKDSRRDPAQERPVIRRIEFEGNLLYGTEMIKARLRNKEGQRLDPVLLDADMKELYRYFKEIHASQDPVPGGIVLRFRVSENPLVVRLDIRGNAELDDAEIKDVLRTQEGFPLSPYHLAADREDVAEAYRALGYHFAHVTEPDVIVLPNGGRRVILTVVEGPEVQVSRIVFRGNSHLPRKDLLEAMLTEAPSFIEQIVGAPTFREAVLREDLVALKNLYRRKGFLDAEVALDDMRFSDDKSRVEISIAITEHQPYTVGKIEFDITREDPGKVASPTPDDIAWFVQARLRTWLGFAPGDQYSGDTIEKGLDKIKEEYFARSYLDVEIRGAQLKGRPRALVVDIEVVIIEGPKYRLARIDFVGNEFTRDKILRREVKTAPGGYVDRNQLERGLTRIRRLQYFDRTTLRIDDALDLSGEPIEGWKNATYELVEASTGRVTFGVTVSTNGGFGAQINFQKRNFDIARWPTSVDDITSGRAWTGAGQEFDILLAPNTEVTQFRVRFREPRFFGSDFSFETAVFKQFEFRESYLTDRLGYSVAMGYPIFTNEAETVGVFGRVSWRHELTKIADVSVNSIPGAFLFSDQNEFRSLTGSITIVTANDFLKPTHETSTSLFAGIAGTFLGGDIDMWTLSAQHQQIWVVHEDDEGKKHRLTGRVTVGLSEALEDTPEVPPWERFYAGGTNFRGFRFRGVGPHVNGFPTGGEWLLTGTLEYEFPIVPDLLSIVAFVDQGTVASALSAPDAFRWRMSVGGGLRVAIPFLLGNRPLALDVGFPIFDEEEDERSAVSFNLGRTF